MQTNKQFPTQNITLFSEKKRKKKEYRQEVSLYEPQNKVHMFAFVWLCWEVVGQWQLHGVITNDVGDAAADDDDNNNNDNDDKTEHLGHVSLQNKWGS